MCTAVDKLVTDNLDIVHCVVNSVFCPDYLVEDAISEGYLELVRVANNYDEDMGVKFGTYAYSCIKKKITWFLIKSKPLKYSTEIIKLCTKVHRYMKEKGVDINQLCNNDWASLGVLNEDVKYSVLTYFSQPKSLQSDIDDRNNEIELIDSNVDIEGDMVSISVVDEINSYLECRYPEKACNTLKCIVRYVVENGVCSHTEIAKRIGIKRQTVHKYCKMLQNDNEFKRLISEV